MLHTYVKIFDVIVTGKKNLPTFTHLNTASLPLARGYKRETGPGGRALVFGPVESVGALPGDEVSVWVSSGRVRSALSGHVVPWPPVCHGRSAHLCSAQKNGCARAWPFLGVRLSIGRLVCRLTVCYYCLLLWYSLHRTNKYTSHFLRSQIF
jgi:hypothetical protein